jgi:hypothetical protein
MTQGRNKGAYPFLVTPDYTAEARSLLGKAHGSSPRVG